MKLKDISVQGFRSFCHPVDIDFCQLTMLIGNNDSGKSSILDILEIALSSNKTPDEKDYFTCINGENADKIEVILRFQLDSNDKEATSFSINKIITYKVIYTKNNATKEYLTELPKEEDLRCDYPKLLAQSQKDLIIKYDPDSQHIATNAEKRCDWFNNFITTVNKVDDWKEVPPDLLKLLPRIQRYSAMDYSSPENLINRTVKQVFETVLYDQILEDDQNERKLRKPLRDLEEEAELKINKKVSELKIYIQKYAPSIENISYEPQIDFTRGFQSGVFKVDEGRGEHYLNKAGDGTKRKVFMATTDWDRDVTLSMQSERGFMPNVIRAYDEPDTNLDYHAQRQLFRSIFDIVSGEKSNVQAIICTHSPRMIDRAPAQNIRMLKEVNGKTTVDKLQICDDREIEFFLSELARELGITNSLMFYENCFILVEGETEENALPLFYRTLFGHSLLEDGINIINIKGKSAFKEFLRLLSHNKQDLTIFFMDQDCNDTEENKMTEQILKDCGFSEDFCKTRILLVGQQEFEDLFSTDILVKIHNNNWPKTEGEWTVDDFLEIDHTKKYSDELKKIVWKYCAPNGNKWSKPELGNMLGKTCKSSEIPEKVKELFDLSRRIADIN